jgi:recombination protein RecT
MADTKQNTQAPQATNTQLVKRETIDIVTAKVKQFQNNGELFFPPNYSPENALKAAWLQLQEVQDKNYKPALQVCTKESIANALLSMVVQGLNPDKKQCYFIVYGAKLQMQRSYFGSMTVTKAVNPDIEEIYADVVYEGDGFKYNKVRGRTVIVEHTQTIENVKKDKIIAAYCMVLYKSGKEESTIMTFDEIKQAWKQSKMGVFDDKGNLKTGGTHEKFTADMCKKTVINRACKPIINSSDDSNILAKYAKQSYTDIAEADAEEEITENANMEYIDVDVTEVEEELVAEPQKPVVEDKPEERRPEQVTIDMPPPVTKRRGF